MTSKKKFSGLKRIFTRRLFIALLILAEIAMIVMTLTRVTHVTAVREFFNIAAAITALHLISRPNKSAFKISLIFIILLFPVFGAPFYWMFYQQNSMIGFRKKLAKIQKKHHAAYGSDQQALSTAKKDEPSAARMMEYLQNTAGFPIFQNTESKYFPSGEKMLPALLADLSKAEKYIFMEYFIIEEGKMWGDILAVLSERAAAGVDVRIIYDDIGCIMKLPPNYCKTLRANGIKCQIFNRFRPFLDTVQNNRDHRKITSIDGKVAYTGGINLADEYINAVQKFGHWKDSAIRFSGDAAWSFTVMFLEMWEFLTKTEEFPNRYKPCRRESLYSKGWVQPYSDSPMDREHVGERVYTQMMERAQNYLYIATPYLMIDDGMISALKLCAKSGIDVRIITPHIPDKKTVHFTTRSYYYELVHSGVKIYEYTPGFIHAKLFVSDDRVATVGTVNLDFRSLYMHFECAACIYAQETILDIKEDFLKTLDECTLITEEKCKRQWFVRLFQSFWRLIAPLM